MSHIKSDKRMIRAVAPAFLLIIMLMAACQPTTSSNNNWQPPDSDYEEETFLVDSQKAECFSVENKKCLIVNGNYFYDPIKGFNFESGYIYELNVRKKKLEGAVPADSSGYSYELVQVISKIPDNSKSGPVGLPPSCREWFDGCNICAVQDGQIVSCTERFCEPDQKEDPKCLREHEQNPAYQDVVSLPAYENPEGRLERPLEIPLSCTYWTDGCNDCRVNEREEVFCTGNACVAEAIEIPRCIRFKQP